MWIIRLLFLYLTMSCARAVKLINAAQHKNCTQSSDFDNSGTLLVATNAIDEDVGSLMQFCASTAHFDLTPWWQVDLKQSYIVHSVLVRNRVTSGFRLHDFTIWVSTDDINNGIACGTVSGAVPDDTTVTLLCEQIAFGRFVKITKPTTDAYDILTLCEVHVLVVDKTRQTFERQVQKTIGAEIQTETSAPNVPSCAKHCHHDPSCSAFRYRPGTDACHLYNSTRTIDSNNHEWRFYVMV